MEWGGQLPRSREELEAGELWTPTGFATWKTAAWHHTPHLLSHLLPLQKALEKRTESQPALQWAPHCTVLLFAPRSHSLAPELQEDIGLGLSSGEAESAWCLHRARGAKEHCPKGHC